jgi:putative thioredoxin
MSSTEIDVTDDTFETEVIERSKQEPVVVDFWADWCGPCKALTPVLEQKTQEKGVTLAKVDVDANQRVAREYNVNGIPAVKAFRNGNVVAEFVGAVPPARVEAFLDELTKPPVAERIEDEELAALLRSGDYEAALERLLARAADPETRDDARKQMVEIFQELGQEHPLASTYRKRLAATLY